MLFVKVVLGTIAMILSIESFSRYLISWKNAKKNIKYKNLVTPNTNIVNNIEALYQAKKYFESLEQKEYRLNEYLKSDADLPIVSAP